MASKFSSGFATFANLFFPMSILPDPSKYLNPIPDGPLCTVIFKFELNASPNIFTSVIFVRNKIH